MLKAVTFFVLALLVHAQNTGASLSGRVANSVTKAGIGGAEIQVCRPTAPSPTFVLCPESDWLTTHTDDAGSYRFTGLPDGQYLLMPLPAVGFFPVFPTQPTINVSGDTRLDLQMIPLAGVRGRVIDPEGKPAAGVVVALDVLGCKGCTALDVSITDQDGVFFFERVRPNDPLILSASPKPQPDAKADEKIVTTYYPSVVDRDQAEQIKSQGVDLFGLDIRLRTASAHKSRGIVIDADGKPVTKALVSIVKPGSGMVAMVRGDFLGGPSDVPVAEPAETKPDGTFAFPPVIEGSWTIRAVLKAGGVFPAGSGSAELVVSKSDVEGVEIHLLPRFDIELAVDWGDSVPATIPFNLTAFIPLDNPQVLPPIPAETSRHLLGFAGRFLVGPGANPPAGYYLAQVLLDNRDVLGQVVPISAGSSLKVVFKTDGGVLRGTVEKGGNAAVVLMADPSPSARLGYSTRCDASGAFVARDIPPGEYTAVAVPGIVGDPLRPEFVTMLAASGKRVKVEASSTAQLDLRLARQ